LKRLPLIQNDLLQRIVDLLRAQPGPCYIAGGWVRDWLLGRAARDVDFSVAEAAIPLARRIANATGGAFYVLDDEMDAARIVYRETEFVVDLAGLRGADITADLRARDFTVNAMAVDLRDCAQPDPPVLDPCGGQRDLAAHILRATNEGAFRQDPVRLLRAVRFQVALSLQVEAETELWLRRDAPLLVRPSAERIRQELVPIVAAPGAADHLRRLDELGLLAVILPEMVALKGVTQPPDHHVYDVYDHTLATVAEVERLTAFPDTRFSPEEAAALLRFAADLAAHFAPAICEKRTRATLLRFAAMLHDVGKPHNRTVKESGRISFYGHEGVSVEMTQAILGRLRFSAQEIQLVSAVVAGHMRPGFLIKDAPVTRRAMYRFFRATGDAAVDVLILSLADHLAARGPTLLADHWRQHLEFTQMMLEHYFRTPQEVASPPQLVTGRDVMSVLGLAPGPQVGQLLEAVREAQAEGQVRTRDEALAFLRTQHSNLWSPAS
jgi:putative nucleotidyltransferase with HDIG domain